MSQRKEARRGWSGDPQEMGEGKREVRLQLVFCCSTREETEVLGGLGSRESGSCPFPAIRVLPSSVPSSTADSHNSDFLNRAEQQRVHSSAKKKEALPRA